MYLVIDIECSGKTTYRRFSNPLDPNHQVDLLGYKYQGDVYKYILKDDIKDAFNIAKLDEVSVIVGHNLKFDLLWLWGNKQLQEWLKNGGKVWDTMTVQYLLDAQRRLPRSLDELSTRYGGTLKDNNMKAFYKAGGQSKDVPLETLLEYNKEDIYNTNLILQKQIKQAKEQDMLGIINVYMDHYLAVIEMEYNGFHVNKKGLQDKVESLKQEQVQLQNDLCRFAAQKGYENFNPLSLDELSLFLFGGFSKVKKKMPQFNEDGSPIMVKKTGLQKEKFEILSIESVGQLNPKKFNELEKNKKGYYFLKDEDLQYIEKQYIDESLKQFIKQLTEYRKLTKKISTYYEGLLECTSPYTGCVHPEFKTAFTDTGRLSSINPNAQNLLPEVLDYIDSRYGENGRIVEIDCSQLEVRIQAYITDCFEMGIDIKNGIDFHVLRLSYAEGLSYEETLQNVKDSHEWALKRKAAKTISFQKAYGASPDKIALETGLDVHTIKHIFEQEDLRYPEIKNFYEAIQVHLIKTRQASSEAIKVKDKKTGEFVVVPGEQKAFGFYKSITGKSYCFEENAVLTKTGSVFRYFSIPKIQNSPIQGTAADFVNCQIGQFYRRLKKSKVRCFMIDEVHDSVLLDVHIDDLTSVTKSAKLILEDVSKFEKLTGKSFTIPMTVDIKINKTWGMIKQND